MTNREALKSIVEDGINLGAGDYVELEALVVAKEALEKRIAMKPIKNPDKYSGLILYYSCPSCGRYFGQRGIHNAILFNKERYCQGDGCGQSLDWSEEKEDWRE